MDERDLLRLACRAMSSVVNRIIGIETNKNKKIQEERTKMTVITKELELVENKELRSKHQDRVEVLDKVKEIITLSNSKVLNTKMVAEYYEVGIEAIKSLYNRNKEELESNGARTLRGEDLKKFKGRLQDATLLGSASVITIFSIRALLNVGMLLRDSHIAKEVRNQLLNIIEKTPDEIKTQSIDEEKQFLMNIMFAKNDAERAIAISEHVEYKNRHIDKLNKQIEENKPLVDFTNKCLKSDTSILVREMSKLLQEEGFNNFGEKKLFQKLREWGLLLKNSTEPSQRAMKLELFEVIQRPIETKHSTILKTTTRITPKGQLYIFNKIKKEMNI